MPHSKTGRTSHDCRVARFCLLRWRFGDSIEYVAELRSEDTSLTIVLDFSANAKDNSIGDERVLKY
jgi:hypothetical protein